MVATPVAANNPAGEGGFPGEELPLVQGFVAEQTPLLMATAAALGGFRPPLVVGGFRYCTLACGAGTTLCALAAVNPAAHFVGIEANPTHVAQGEATARQLGLRNLEFVQAPFSALEQKDTLGAFDFVALNGSYAWLEEPEREAAMAFVHRHLKDGGLLYVESAVLPAMAGLPPLWHLLQTLTPLSDRSPRQRAEEGLNLLETLAKRGLSFLAANPLAAAAARHYISQRKTDPEAALDQFLNNAIARTFRPRYFDTMAAEMAAVDLQFAGRTSLALNIVDLAVPPGQVPTLRDIPDPVQQQLLIDYIRNEQNRRDVYIKSSSPDSLAAAAFLTQELRLLARNAPETLQRTIPVIGGHGVPLRGPHYDALLQAFEAQPATCASVSLPESTTPEQRLRASQMLIASHQFVLCLPGSAEPEAAPSGSGAPQERPALNGAINRLLLDSAAERLQLCNLVSPLTGGLAISLSPLEALLLQAALEQGWNQAPKTVHARLSQESTPLPSARGPVPANRVRLEDLQPLLDLLSGRKATNMRRLGILL